jgi:hypothetical protein
MAKKDIIEDILNVTDMFTKSELEGKKNEELEKILKLGQSVAEAERMKEEQESKMSEENTDEGETVPPLDDTKYKRLKKPSLDKNELIPVMNITNGSLIYQSKKTGLEVKFEQYGDIEYLEVGELLTMRSGQRRFLDEPWILIMDNEVVEYLGLEKLYKKLENPQNIDRIFAFDNEQFKAVVENAPRGYAQLIVSRAKAKLKDGSLDSVAKIKVLEERFKVELQV